MIDWYDGPGIGEEIDRLLIKMEKDAKYYYSGDADYDAGYSSGILHVIDEIRELLYGP